MKKAMSNSAPFDTASPIDLGTASYTGASGIATFDSVTTINNTFGSSITLEGFVFRIEEGVVLTFTGDYMFDNCSFNTVAESSGLGTVVFSGVVTFRNCQMAGVNIVLETAGVVMDSTTIVDVPSFTGVGSSSIGLVKDPILTPALSLEKSLLSNTTFTGDDEGLNVTMIDSILRGLLLGANSSIAIERTSDEAVSAFGGQGAPTAISVSRVVVDGSDETALAGIITSECEIVVNGTLHIYVGFFGDDVTFTVNEGGLLRTALVSLPSVVIPNSTITSEPIIPEIVDGVLTFSTIGITGPYVILVRDFDGEDRTLYVIDPETMEIVLTANGNSFTQYDFGSQPDFALADGNYRSCVTQQGYSSTPYYDFRVTGGVIGPTQDALPFVPVEDPVTKIDPITKTLVIGLSVALAAGFGVMVVSGISPPEIQAPQQEPKMQRIPKQEPKIRRIPRDA